MISVTRGVDEGLRLLLYTKFYDILGLDISGTDIQRVNSGVLLYPREIALREASEKRGQDYLEFISLWRVSTSPSWSRQRTSVARRGVWLPSSDGSKSAVNVKAQPVDLSYSAWFWSKSLDKIYQCLERYIMWQQDYPKIDLSYELDDNNSFDYSPDLHFGEMVDESTIYDKYEKGTMFVYRVPINVDAWVFDGLASKTITKITLKYYDSTTEDAYYTRLWYGISSVDLDQNSITIYNDRVDDFSVDDKIIVEDSTGNDGQYTIASVSLSGDDTEIVVDETIPDSTADGVITKILNS